MEDVKLSANPRLMRYFLSSDSSTIPFDLLGSKSAPAKTRMSAIPLLLMLTRLRMSGSVSRDSIILFSIPLSIRVVPASMAKSAIAFLSIPVADGYEQRMRVMSVLREYSAFKSLRITVCIASSSYDGAIQRRCLPSLFAHPISGTRILSYVLRFTR